MELVSTRLQKDRLTDRVVSTDRTKKATNKEPHFLEEVFVTRIYLDLKASAEEGR